MDGTNVPQVTDFRRTDTSLFPGYFSRRDQRVYFTALADPLGLNSNGSQLFAIQPDGTGLRQLTNARGFVQGADRTVEVETVDFAFRYSPPR